VLSDPSDGAESWDEPYEARVLLLKWSTRNRYWYCLGAIGVRKKKKFEYSII
jgi:hypothetical protein